MTYLPLVDGNNISGVKGDHQITMFLVEGMELLKLKLLNTIMMMKLTTIYLPSSYDNINTGAKAPYLPTVYDKNIYGIEDDLPSNNR